MRLLRRHRQQGYTGDVRQWRHRCPQGLRREIHRVITSLRLHGQEAQGPLRGIPREEHAARERGNRHPPAQPLRPAGRGKKGKVRHPSPVQHLHRQQGSGSHVRPARPGPQSLNFADAFSCDVEFHPLE